MSTFGATTNDFVVSYTVAESFSYDGRLCGRGDVLAKDDPVVPAVLSSRPGLLLVWVRKEEGRA